MIKNLQKIVVVGGGSAGWMSASFLKKALPNKEVILIESPNIPSIGVGESTLGSIKPFLFFLDLDEKEFMRDSDASYKMSIKFTNFYKNDGSSFQYPFGKPFEESQEENISDWLIKKHLYPDTPLTDFVDCFYPAAHLFQQNKFDLNQQGLFDNFNPFLDVAYHFDAVKFANHLRTKYRDKVGIKHILATVEHIITCEDGIKELILESGEKITADLFVDCTGFKSLLIGETLKQQFSAFNYLPNNRAWACQVPYKNKGIELEGFTNCTAIENGWCWNTPVWSRLGTGYVYSDKYVDPENAKEEFKKYLMTQMICNRSRKEVDNLVFKDISFRVGGYKNSFVKNVVAIGMSAGFIEPLESNGLYSIHEFLVKLLQILRRDVVTQFEKDLYSKNVYDSLKAFSTFVASHYVLSARYDTEYWKANLNRSINDLDQEASITMHKHLGNNMFSSHKFPNIIDGMNWISVGMNWLYNDPVATETSLFMLNRGIYEQKFANWEKRKIRWKMAAQNAISLLEHQSKHIYN